MATENPLCELTEVETTRTSRTCPKCSTIFSSVQSLGVCPVCRHSFRIGADGGRDRRNRVLANLASALLMVWLPFWVFCMPILLVWHWTVNGFTLLDAVVIATFVLLVSFGRVPGLVQHVDISRFQLKM